MLKVLYLFLAAGIFSGTSNLHGTSKVTAEKQFVNRKEPAEVYKPNPQDHPFPALFVQHKIKGDHVFIECIVTGITFRETEQATQKVGKMIVWIDGKRNSVVDSAAFIIKGLKPGNHKIKLEVVSLQNVPYGLDKEFMVNIPE